MSIKVNNPFIKDPVNIAWLEANFETFLDYMAKRHSLVDCWHTVLDLSTFDDNYISQMIKNVEATDKKKVKEAKARQKGISTEKTSGDKKADKIKEKQGLIEKAVLEQKRAQEQNDELPD